MIEALGGMAVVASAAVALLMAGMLVIDLWRRLRWVPRPGLVVAVTPTSDADGDPLEEWQVRHVDAEGRQWEAVLTQQPTGAVAPFPVTLQVHRRHPHKVDLRADARHLIRLALRLVAALVVLALALWFMDARSTDFS